MSKYKVGSNQFQLKLKIDESGLPTESKQKILLKVIYFAVLLIAVYDLTVFLSPTQSEASENVNQGVSQKAIDPAESMQVVAPVATPAGTFKPEPKPTELVEVVAEIAQTFEPEGKHVVVQAINCFYSESGLRPNAVGQNKDTHKSKDHGVAQLNDHWHKLTEEEKTDIRANIKRAYKIYKGRGGNFSAWYGKLCN